MSDTRSRPKAYLLKSCPFCLKLRIFLTEAGLADRVKYVTFDSGDETHQRLRGEMEAADRKPSFPAVEFEPGRFETGTDDLIARFAGEASVVPDALPLLRYYSEGVFEAYGDMFREMRELKAAQAV